MKLNSIDLSIYLSINLYIYVRTCGRKGSLGSPEVTWLMKLTSSLNLRRLSTCTCAHTFNQSTHTCHCSLNHVNCSPNHVNCSLNHVNCPLNHVYSPYACAPTPRRGGCSTSAPPQCRQRTADPTSRQCRCNQQCIRQRHKRISNIVNKGAATW
jgi:hypothetical protein